ncbi:DUF2075 domain-containing protein [Anaerotalea alkaliphila]|uniref:DUF2075 domain-containing protein n=1 Tax=Anaerotalea alkaliphila TaxID=2662126 RepID=A0A7X5KN10_9FIRM|nr:DUF2075 domain-containing protein [Anaerotalea alkaliphila]NDL67544.1 DUF2075 domain-containing protein [Anaerotalea alkaliphila]
MAWGRGEEGNLLLDMKFQPYLQESPLFTEGDTGRIWQYIRNHVDKGEGMEILDHIQTSIPRPSRKLIRHINSILDAKAEFILMEQQLVVYDRVMQLVREKALDGSDGRYVVLVKGGPGTGKSVVGLNLLGKILQEGKECIYLAPNAAFRNGMAARLDPERARRVFKHPYFYNKELTLSGESFQTAIVDEAHRISLSPPPMQRKLGKSLVEEIIDKTWLSVFFTDDNQMIRPSDIGSYDHVKERAKALGCTVYEYELEAQFRCAGSQGYLNWIDDVLGIRETANASGWENMDGLEFRILEDPNEMLRILQERQEEGYDARMVAGYAWPWSKELEMDGNLVKDVEIFEDGKRVFGMPWNPQDSYKTRRGKGIPANGGDWAVNPDGINQVGCIHTCQGLEFDYVGVIIGEEFTYDPERGGWTADVKKCHDRKIGANSRDKFLRLAQNTYKTLMTRGMKGVYVYSVDPATREHLKQRLKVVQELEENRFYRRKKTTLRKLLLGDFASDAAGGYVGEKTIRIQDFQVKPMDGSHYFCDIHQEQQFLQEVREVAGNRELELDRELEARFNGTPQIRGYAPGVEGLVVDIGIMKIRPKAVVKRMSGGKERIAVVFGG